VVNVDFLQSLSVCLDGDYQGLSSRAHLAKSGLLDGLFLSYLMTETTKHLFWDCSLARLCSKHVRTNLSTILQGQLHWCLVLLGNSEAVVHSSLSGIWHCLRKFSLFVLWKLWCKYIFENEVSSLSAFCFIWRE
jgi:hypothetical protein